MNLENASLVNLDHYLQINCKFLTTCHEKEVVPLFNSLFKIAVETYPKEHCLRFLEELLINFAKSHFVTEKDIEEAYDKFIRFKENK